MIIIYNKSLTNFKEITHATSIQMIEYYNDIGKMIIVLPMDDYNISAVENEGTVYDTIRDMAFTIQNYKFDTEKNEITIYGYTTNWILDKRVLAQKKYFSNVERGVYEAVEANLRNLPNVTVAKPAGYTERSDSVLYGGQLLTKLIPVLNAAGLGHKMKFDPDLRKHVFMVRKGQDLTAGIHAVTFTQEFGTAQNLVITRDQSTFKNCIYVQGVLRNETEIVEIVGNTQGEDRSELWLRNTYAQETDETEAQLRARMTACGNEEIAKRVPNDTFSVSIDPSEYGEIYNLGDIVSASSAKLKVELHSRITGVKYVLDRQGENVSLILGEPIITIIGEEKLNSG